MCVSVRVCECVCGVRVCVVCVCASVSVSGSAALKLGGVLGGGGCGGLGGGFPTTWADAMLADGPCFCEGPHPPAPLTLPTDTRQETYPHSTNTVTRLHRHSRFCCLDVPV